MLYSLIIKGNYSLREAKAGKRNKMKADMVKTKEEIKDAYLDMISEKAKLEWHSQKAHKLAVALWFLDALEVKEQGERDKVLKAWAETPGSFGTNCSALGQALGRESGPSKTETTFAGF